jgi:cellulose synthase/poly-beta-1,6-N-acetylglucosamine synthase-like glycosyltransferase
MKMVCHQDAGRKDEGMIASEESTAVIIPTLKRPDYLRRCLDALTAQTVPPASVLVGVRNDDTASCAVVQEFMRRMPVKMVEAQGVGVIGSMSSCLAHTSEKFVALVDDDVELPPHWLGSMLVHLENQKHVLAAAGRDFLQDDARMRRREMLKMDVGRILWYGRITGNHHCGGGHARKVEVLRGSNCLFRGGFLREVGFECELRGQGAQVNWELALAFQALQRGSGFFYDPGIEVIHHVAPRSDADQLHRGGWDAEATAHSAFNETLVVRKHLRGFQRVTCLAYQALIGSPLAPGFLHALKRCLGRDRFVHKRIAATFSGRMAALLHSKSPKAKGMHLSK